VAVGIFILAEAIVTVLFGEKWLSIIPVWQIFSLYALTRPISANASPLFMAVGKPGYNLHASLLGLAVVIPLVLWLIGPLGIIGVAAAVSVSHLVTMVFNVYQVNRLLPGTARQTMMLNFPFAITGGLMALGVQLAKVPLLQQTGGEYNIISLVLLIAIGGLIYLSLTLILQRELLKEIFGLMSKAIGLDKRWPRLVPQRLRPGK
jgi:O-antigen/teichoic acid export membrane protein